MANRGRGRGDYYKNLYGRKRYLVSFRIINFTQSHKDSSYFSHLPLSVFTRIAGIKLVLFSFHSIHDTFLEHIHRDWVSAVQLALDLRCIYKECYRFL